MAWRSPACSMAVIVAWLVAACVPVPPIGQQLSEEEQASIIVGATTKSEISEILGEPDIAIGDEAYIYEFEQTPPAIFLIGYGYTAPRVYPLGEVERQRLLLEFDESEVLAASQLVRKQQDWDTCKSNSIEALPRAWDTDFSVRAQRSLHGVEFSKDGNLLIAANWKTGVFVWDRRDDWSETLLPPNGECKGSIDCRVISIAVGASNTIAAAKIDGSVWIWDLQKNGRLRVKEHSASRLVKNAGISVLELSPDERVLVTGDEDGVVEVWDLKTGKRLSSVRAHGGRVSDIAFAPSGRSFATASNEGSFKLWDTTTSAQLGSEKRSATLKQLAFAPDGSKLAITSEQHVEVWNIGSEDEDGAPNYDAMARVLALPIAEVSYLTGGTVVFSPNSKMIGVATLIGGVDGRADTWDIQTGEHLQCYRHPRITGMSFSPDGKTIATSGLDRVLLWQLN